ncbi:hypothetical protein OQA88_5157 [Cercophora sp. LCS_1]
MSSSKRRASSPEARPSKRRRAASTSPSAVALPVLLLAALTSPPAAATPAGSPTAPAPAAAVATPLAVAATPPPASQPAENFRNVRVFIDPDKVAIAKAKGAAWKPPTVMGRLDLVFFVDGSEQQRNSGGVKPPSPPYHGGFAVLTANIGATGHFTAQGHMIEKYALTSYPSYY